MMQYVLGSGVFAPESETANRVVQYLQQHGGHIMGMLSSHAETNLYWMAGRKVNDLYGMRYALLMLRRDEPDRALVSFYGKLAHGFTRDTFIGGEGSDIVPLDENGRLMYLPPNSAANANFLQQFRYLLVQDYDLNDDGRAETLRLGFAAPRGWMKNGSRIRVTNAPTPRDFRRLNAPILPRVGSASTSASGRICAEARMAKSARVNSPAITTTLNVSGA